MNSEIEFDYDLDFNDEEIELLLASDEDEIDVESEVEALLIQEDEEVNSNFQSCQEDLLEPEDSYDIEIALDQDYFSDEDQNDIMTDFKSSKNAEQVSSVKAKISEPCIADKKSKAESKKTDDFIPFQKPLNVSAGRIVKKINQTGIINTKRKISLSNFDPKIENIIVTYNELAENYVKPTREPNLDLFRNVKFMAAPSFEATKVPNLDLFILK